MKSVVFVDKLPTSLHLLDFSIYFVLNGQNLPLKEHRSVFASVILWIFDYRFKTSSNPKNMASISAKIAHHVLQNINRCNF